MALAPVQEPAGSGRAARFLALLASLRLTLAILALLGAAVLASYLSDASAGWWLALPLAAGACNLLAAIVSNGAFRRQPALLVFHLALLALLVLLAAGRLTYLKGKAEIVEGGTFAGDLIDLEAGPWHLNRLGRVKFVNDGFSIDYAPGLRRGATRNSLRYLDEGGVLRQIEIGDNQPLLLYGYRFYTSFNKGFAPIFRWHPKDGAASLGAVHLPAYPLHEYEQTKEWMLPDTTVSVQVALQIGEQVIDPEKADRFKIPKNHAVLLRLGEQRWELHPGESVELDAGRLDYDGLRAWMGYQVFYDWTLPWLLAACVTTVAALGLHFWLKFSSTPWDA